MKLLLVSVWVLWGVLGCSDCFSRCSGPDDKRECLLDCGCPLFTPWKVYSGRFEGSQGLVYVVGVEQGLGKWVGSSLGCDLQCGSVCSSLYLDTKLESCVQACGCGALLSSELVSENDSVKAKCDSICRGSPYGCFLDCVGHIEELCSPFYLWVAFPVLFLVLGLAWFVIKPSKDDDYLRI